MTVLKCPKCLGDTRVIGGTYYYKKRANGTMNYRRRKCQACGYKYTTIEMPVMKIKPIKPVVEDIFDFAEA